MATCKTAIKAACRFARKQCHIAKHAFSRKDPSERSPTPVDASSIQHNDDEGADDDSSPQISFDHEMTAIIKYNLSQNREMELEQAQTSGKATAVDKKLSKLRDARIELQDKLATAESSHPKCDDETQRLGIDISALDDQICDLEQEKEALNQHLRWVEGCQREVLRDVFDAIDEYCVEAGLMGAVDPSPADEYLRMAGETQDSGTETPEPASASTTPNAPKKAEPDSPHAASRRSSHVSSTPLEPATSPYIIPKVDEKESLRLDYRIARACVREVEEDFELREEHFDQIRAEYAAEAGNDDSSAARLQLDLDELRETRRLAIEMTKAEDWLLEVKGACLAAGVDIASSDLSSGFLDDVNDGYRISEEKELIEMVNPAGVASWLSQIPDDIDFESGHQDGLDIDDWDAESVEIEDSASMVAEGASRRRIDKWRAMCQAVAAADESMGLFSMEV